MDTKVKGVMEMTIGKQLKKKRRQLGLTLEEVANAIGISANYVSLIERDKHVPNDEIITKLAELYKMDLDTLFKAFGKIPTPIVDELINNESLRKILLEISNDKRLTDEEKQNLSERLSYWYKKATEKK
jgi:transcriptional regulator with XRE-family HTH domain